MERKKYKKGEIIFIEGSPGKEMYIIHSGGVNVYKTINEEKINLSVLRKNDFFGEMRLLLGCPRTASIEARERTEVLVVTKDTLLHKIKEDPRFALRVITVMAKRLMDADAVITVLQGQKSSLEIMFKSGR